MKERKMRALYNANAAGRVPMDTKLDCVEEPCMHTNFGMPDSVGDYVNHYGTYNIQPTAEADTLFPLISHALPTQWKDMAIGKEETEKQR